MASPGNGRIPWYRRLFGARPAEAPAAPPPPRPSVTYYCTDCRFSSKLRGVVYDHIKSFHKDVLDRHGHIAEEAQAAH